LNGKQLDNCWIYQRELAAGGLLELWLGAEPNENWGRGLPLVKRGGATKNALWRSYQVPNVTKSPSKGSDEPKASPMFRRMDRDGNGSVSKREFLAFWMHAFSQQDIDGDSMLTVEEFGSRAAFKNMDVDGDGLATKKEFEAMYQRQFNSMDKDQNKQLRTSEL
jgi:Ca2+-binding EF-hand superfamily protein